MSSIHCICKNTHRYTHACLFFFVPFKIIIKHKCLTQPLLPQTWDKDLAITAREWARKCTFEHNPDLKLAERVPPKFSSVGENIWTGYPTTLFNATWAIQNWVDEKQDYDYNNNTCKNVCDHYKQVCAEMPYGLCSLHN